MNIPTTIPGLDALPRTRVPATMVISGLGISSPTQRYTQQQCWQVLCEQPVYRRLNTRSQALLRKTFSGSNGIGSRHLALEPLTQVFDIDPDVLQQRFEHHAPALAAAAAAKALANAGVDAHVIDAVVVSTCTGYICPGISTYLIERLGLRADVLPLDFVGGGCGAAVPNMQTAHALLASQRYANVLSVCVEVCSAAFYMDDDPGVLISTCLFGDGAAAAILQREHAPTHAHRKVSWCASGSLSDPTRRDLLRFEHRHGMLRNILSATVPGVAAEFAEDVLDRVLRDQRLARADIATWIWHAGGRDVLQAIRNRIGLDHADTRWSEEVLAEYGNLSSPSVLFALESALRGGAAPGWWWLSTFGAGFACHGALLRVS